MKTLNFLAFAAAAALTLSTSSCSKKENVAPAAQPEAAAASTDAATFLSASADGNNTRVVFTLNSRHNDINIRLNGTRPENATRTGRGGYGAGTRTVIVPSRATSVALFDGNTRLLGPIAVTR